jgi:single-stranded-DNA-specific exonuclease
LPKVAAIIDCAEFCVMIVAKLPQHRWQIAAADAQAALDLARSITVTPDAPTSPLIAQVLLNRGISSVAQVERYVYGVDKDLPDPAVDFKDLAVSVDLLVAVIAQGSKIAICGDYDADGMTSTALLLRAVRSLGGNINYEIPSRMQDGYGINRRIVEKFHEEGVALVLTVDNGIAAYDAIDRAVALGLKVIVTDHHDLPPQLPPAHAILNPKLIPEESIYYSIAGVGVAYLLAVALADRIGDSRQSTIDPQLLTGQMLELFTLGTIADLAALTGINRTLVKQGLKRLANSQILGVRALVAASGAGDQKIMRPEDIGFKLGPRINAIGRIGDPQTIIELLTTEDPEIATERAAECEATNRRRQELCAEIEEEAIELVETELSNYRENRILVVIKEGWHHGVIGIVASRLVERYGVPVFIGTSEEDDDGVPKIRGSVRSIPEFNVFESLEFCKDLFLKHGGHPAAGGFSLLAEHLPALRDRLRTFAYNCLEPEHLRTPISVDVLAQLVELDNYTYQQIDAIQPCGMGNPEPVFWSKNVRVAEQRTIGKDSSHLKLTVATSDFPQGIKGVAWRWADYYPLPDRLDIAYKLRENKWQGRSTIEIELVSARLPEQAPGGFRYENRDYSCELVAGGQELAIVNEAGAILIVQKGQKVAKLVAVDGREKAIDVTEPFFFQLVKAAQRSLDPAAQQ